MNWFVSSQILNSPDTTTVINDVNLPLLYFSSQNGGVLVVQLDEKCGYPVPSMTTPSQILNITQANTTISPANTTSFPQNTTVEPQNSTISTNASSTAANYTSPAIISTTTDTTEVTTESGRGAPCECVFRAPFVFCDACFKYRWFQLTARPTCCSIWPEMCPTSTPVKWISCCPNWRTFWRGRMLVCPWETPPCKLSAA